MLHRSHVRFRNHLAVLHKSFKQPPFSRNYTRSLKTSRSSKSLQAISQKQKEHHPNPQHFGFPFAGVVVDALMVTIDVFLCAPKNCQWQTLQLVAGGQLFNFMTRCPGAQTLATSCFKAPVTQKRSTIQRLCHPLAHGHPCQVCLLKYEEMNGLTMSLLGNFKIWRPLDAKW